MGALSLAACGPAASTGTCPATPVKFADVHALSTNCVACHSSTLSGAQRQGAPSGIDYDSYASASANAAEGLDQISAGFMPPVGGGSISTDDVTAFSQWVACGTPK